MTLFDRTDFAARVSALPAVTLHEQWGALVAKVGGKVFALLSLDADAPRIVFKVPEESFEVLVASGGAEQAPYFAKRQWVSVGPDAPLTEADIIAYVTRSHATMTGKLTRKARAELGLQ